MAYQPLGKLYYGDPGVYAQTYQERFHSADTVTLDFFVAQKQAFFVQNTEVLKLAYQIVKLDKAVSKLSGALPGVAKEQYSKKCLIDEIVLTNSIEGVHSSRKEINEALEILARQTEKQGKHRRFTGLVNKYLKLMTGEEIPLTTSRDVRAIYDELFLEEVTAEDPKNAPDGRIFRKELTTVHSETDKVIHRGLYPESEIISSMEKALHFLNDPSVDRLCRVCIFHYLIEYIHPFYDGNGRLGRFILSYCLSEILDPLLSYRLSETIKENLKEYYKAFSLCNDPRNLGDLTPFLIMLLRMIYSALSDLEKALNRRLISWKKYVSLVRTFPEAADRDVLSLYNILIQAALFSENGISTEELRSVTDKSYYAVKKLLSQIQPGLLRSELKGKAKYYQTDLAALDAILLEKALQSGPEGDRDEGRSEP